jgi:IS5 family transposase
MEKQQTFTDMEYARRKRVWFNLADEAVEEQIYDSYAMRQFTGIDFTEEGAPDATTRPDFRHLLGKD